MNELVPFEGQLLDGVETPRKSKERKSKEEVFWYNLCTKFYSMKTRY